MRLVINELSWFSPISLDQEGKSCLHYMLNHSRVVNESTQSLSNRFEINNARVQLFSLLLSIYSIQHHQWIGSKLALHVFFFSHFMESITLNYDGLIVLIEMVSRSNDDRWCAI